MDIDGILFRVRCIHKAMGALKDSDVSKFPMKVEQDATKVQFVFEGLSKEDKFNAMYVAIDNVAKLYEHVKKWATLNDQDVGKVKEVFDNTLALRIVYDIHNLDKHPYPDRKGGTSGLSPRMGEIIQPFVLGGAPAKPGEPPKRTWAAVTLGPKGVQAHGTGSVALVLDADVMDGSGRRIGSMRKYLSEAVTAWEDFLKSKGIKI